MILTLEVIGKQAERLGAASRKEFAGVGGTIGRLPDNDWVLNDPFVSGRHALIRYRGGAFFVEDISTNGVFINSPTERLPPGEAHQLRDGDVLFLDSYEVRVSLSKDANAADPLALLRSLMDKDPGRAG